GAARAVRIAGDDRAAGAERRARVAGHALLGAGRVATDAVHAEPGLALPGVVAREAVADQAAGAVHARVRAHAIAVPFALVGAALAVAVAGEGRARDAAACRRAGAVTVAARLRRQRVARLVAARFAADGGVVVELAAARAVAQAVHAAAGSGLLAASVVGRRLAARDRDAGAPVVGIVAGVARVGAGAVAADAVGAALGLALVGPRARLALLLAAGRAGDAAAAVADLAAA